MFDENENQAEIEQLQSDADYLDKEIQRLDEMQSMLTDDFADLLVIIMDEDSISAEVKQKIKDRFFPPPTPEQQKLLDEMRAKYSKQIKK
jgi:predicted nuclease with TOPRIM domain